MNTLFDNYKFFGVYDIGKDEWIMLSNVNTFFGISYNAFDIISYYRYLEDDSSLVVVPLERYNFTFIQAINFRDFCWAFTDWEVRKHMPN